MGKIAEGDWDDSTESGLGDCIAEAIDDFGPDFDEEGNPLEEGESDRIRSEEERAKPGRTASEDEETEEQEDAEREKEPASA